MTSNFPHIELSEIMVSRGGSVDPSKFLDEKFELYSIPAYDSGCPEFKYGSQIGSSKQVVRRGDVLLSKIVPHIRRAWVVGGITDHRLIASGEWIVFRSDKFDPNYLRQLVLSDTFHEKLMNTVAGIGGSLLRARPAFVAKISVPMPGVPEQRRIAEVLDRVDALQEKRRRSITLLNDLTQSIFADMFGGSSDPWGSVPLNSAAIEFRYGTSTKSSSEGYPTLRIPNVLGVSLDLSELKTVTVTPDEFRRLRLQEGDLLFVRTNGNADYIGRSAVFEEALVEESGHAANEWIYASYLIRVRLDRARFNPIFVKAFLDSPRGRHALRGNCKTSAGQYNINTSGLGAIEMPSPPIDWQNAFAAKIASVKRAEPQLKQHQNLLDALFASIQHRAFRGELWQDDVKAV